MWRELGMWPPPYSAASRTSTNGILAVDHERGLHGRHARAAGNACQVCQSSMPPLNTARPTQGRLSLRNASNGCSVIPFRLGTPQKTSRIMHDELQRALVADAVINPVGILAREQHPFVAQNRQMLGNVALRGADRVDDFLHADPLGRR
jgi:hypothetical protein